MIVPSKGNWIMVKNNSGIPGKVVIISTDSKTCKVIFGNRVDNAKGAEIEVQFKDIITTINDKARVDALNKKLNRIGCET